MPHPLAAGSESNPRRALLLAGGGMRVAWQAGALIALEEAGLRFHHFDGASGGTINLAMLLSGLCPREMAARWLTLSLKHFVSPLPLADYLNADWPAMGDSDGIRSHIFPHLGIQPDAIRRASGVTATFNVCNVGRKTLEAVNHTEIDEDLLIAAISLPGFMPAVTSRGSTYLDAVWIKDTNVWEAVRRGAEEIWLLWCIGNAPEYHNGAFRQYVHMIEMSANGALFEEISRVDDLNGRIAKGDSPYGQRRPVVLHVIRPEQALPLDPDFYLGNISAGTLVALGYRAASDYLRDRRDDGVALDPEVTAMTEAQPGVSFRETMSGPFAMGAVTPDEGAATAAFQVAMHAQVHIPDIAAFVADPTHTGMLSGTVDLPPFGEGLVCPHGVFRLFSPAGDPATKHMVYELAFEHAGQAYYLEGHKVVRDDPGFDLWSDTTTLYTTLHQGKDQSGPVVGAGRLSLGVTDLVKLVTTVRVTNASGPAQKASTIAAFGRFFLGKLWTTYAHHAEN